MTVFVYVVELFGQYNDLQSADGSIRSTFFGPAFKVHPEKSVLKSTYRPWPNVLSTISQDIF